MKYAKVLYLLIIFLLLAYGSKAHGQAHSVSFTITDSSCTTSAPCPTPLIYRATGSCATVSGCTWTAVTLTTLVATPTATGTTWTGNDTSITAAGTYSWYTTATFTAVTAGGGVSLPSNIFSGTITAPTPVAPVLGGVVKW